MCLCWEKKQLHPSTVEYCPPSVNEKRDNFELRDTWQTNLQTRVNRIKPGSTLIHDRKEMYTYYYYHRCIN